MRSISVWKTAPTAGLLALGIGTAHAADVRQAPPPSMPPLLQSAPPLLVDEFGSGWYLRGDLGYRMNRVDSVTAIGPAGAATDPELGDSWMIGGGVGYKWEWLRGDVTVDYATRADFRAGSAFGPVDYSAKVDTLTALVNVYGDLGTWYGLTPYVGAGVGMAHVRAANFHVDSFGGFDAESGKAWNFAWALMAGVSYRVMGNAHIDLGYRYLNLGDVTTGVDPVGNELTLKKLSADEFRLGFRYVLD